jgi:hypothetical protein
LVAGKDAVNSKAEINTAHLCYFPHKGWPEYCAFIIYLDLRLPQLSILISWPGLFVNQMLLGTPRKHRLAGHPGPTARRLAGLDGCISLYPHPRPFAPKLGRA